MKLPHSFFAAAAGTFIAAGVFSAAAQPSNTVTTAPVYVPDYSHANEPLKDGVFAWEALTQTETATNEQDFARFTFSFTNVTAENATILNVHPSCGCTTAELPPVPWTIPPGASGEIKLNVNLQGKTEMPGPAVILDEAHRCFEPILVAGFAMQQLGAQLVVAVAEDVGRHFDDVADDVIAQLVWQKMRQQRDTEVDHVGSSPMSTPAAMRCRVRSDACSERLPAGVTA